jgi:hypothetical protein
MFKMIDNNINNYVVSIFFGKINSFNFCLHSMLSVEIENRTTNSAELHYIG